MATDDFFLKFGSDAGEFSKQLGTDLGQGVREINALSAALLKYDETVEKVRNSRNPLGNLFTNLDQASAKLENIGNQLSSQFSKIIDSVGSLTADLRSALDAVHQAGIQVRQQKPATTGGRVGADGFTAEQRRIIEAQRRGAVSAVSDADIEAAASGRGKSPSQAIQARTMQQLNRDAVEARNSLRTVANASSTVARNSRDAAGGIGELGKAIRLLTTQTKTTTHGITEGRFQQNTIHIGGGGAPVLSQGASVDELLRGLGVQAQQGPVRDAAHQAERDKQAERAAQRASEQALFDLKAPAQPGFYRLNGQEGKANERSVDARINPGESFEQYFTRRASNSAELDRIRQQVRQGSEERVGTARAGDLEKIQNLVGRRGLDQLLGDPRTRSLQSVKGVSNQEQIRASLGASFAPSKALTPRQYELLPEALKDFSKRLEEFSALSEQHIRGRLQENPLETFALGGRGDGGAVFGRNNDFRAVLAEHDRVHGSQGADFRSGIEETQAERRRNGGVLRGAYMDLDGPDPQSREAGRRLAASRLYDEQRAANSFINPKQAAEQDRLAQEAIAAAKRQTTETADLDVRLNQAAAAVNRLTNTLATTPATGGSGGGRKPPKKPPTSGSNPEPEDDGNDDHLVQPAPRDKSSRSGTRRPGGIADGTSSPALNATLSGLQQSTKVLLETTRARLGPTAIDPNATKKDLLEQARQLGIAGRSTMTKAELGDAVRAKQPVADAQARRELLARAGAAFQQDPLYRGLGSRAVQKSTFRDLLGLPATAAINKEIHRALGQGGDSEKLRGVDRPRSGGAAADGAPEAAALARLEAILGVESKALREALLAEFTAQERLNKLRASGTASASDLAAAERALSSAQRGTARTTAAITPRTLGQRAFGVNPEDRGKNNFVNSQIGHIGRGLENVIGYSLVFTGLEKLKELVHTGLEAQAAFVRLQAALDANGLEAGNLQTHLQGIASSTATPLEHVIEAASELAGVFRSTADLEFGTKIAAQLANISQGTLTTKEAAVGLRDVIDAYGLTGRASIQAVGDEIARLSQLTGVSVKDITEGTTQIAQEAKEFGLSQHQASTLAAYVSRGTGQSGEQSASQTSRLLASFYNGQAQRQLISAGVATSKDFQTGNISGVLTNLIAKYKDLAPAQRQAIAGLVGTGIQARAFASVVNIGAVGLAEYNSQQTDMGALGRQNARVLQTIAGQVKQLDEDFQSLGSNLTRIGAFDFIGALAKTFDSLLKVVNATFGRIADLAGKSPATSFLLHLTTVALEAAFAFKLLGAASVGFLNRRLPNVQAFQPTNAAAVAERQRAIAGGAALPPIAPTYRQPTVTGAIRGTGRAALGGFGLVGAGRNVEEAGRLQPGTPGYTNAITRQGRALAQSESAAIARLGPAVQNAGLAMTGLRAKMSETGTAAKNVTGGIGGFQLALLGIGVAISVVTAELADAAARAAATKAIRDSISGSSSTTTAEAPETAVVTATQKNLDKTRHTGLLQGFFSTERHGPSVFNTGGPSSASQDAELQLMHDEQKRLREAYASNDPTKIVEAQKAIDEDIQKRKDEIARAGGNNKENQAEIYASIVALQNGIRTSAAARLKTLEGFAQIDVLNQQQEIALSALVQQSTGLSGSTIASNPDAIKGIFDQSGIPQQSKAGQLALKGLGVVVDANGRATVDSGSTARSRLQAQLENTDLDIRQQTVDLNDPGKINQLGGLQGQSYKDLQASRDQNLQMRQQLALQIQQNEATSLGGASATSEQVGGYAAAVSALQSVNANLTSYLSTLDSTDPTYWATLKQIQDNKDKIGQLLTDNINNAINIQLSATNDPVIKAQLALRASQNALANVPVVHQAAENDTQASDPNRATVLTPGRVAAIQTVNQNRQGGAQAQEALAAALAQQRSAGIRNTSAKAQADLNETLRQESVARGGVLRDDTKLASLRAQETQNRIAVADADHADAQAVYGAQAALDQLHGNAVGSAAEEVAKAWADYAYQAAQYGAGSAQAQQAIGTAYSAQQSLIAAQLERLNSGLDLQIAQSTTRGDLVGVAQETYSKAQNALHSFLANGGQTGTTAYNKLLADAETASKALSDARLEQLNAGLDLQIAQFNARGKLGDENRAAALATQKAKNALAQYKRRGGHTGTAEYDKLAADVATAQRTQFDTALQAQLDTLDFQKATYQITSAQEIASLQQILKNKQLTLAEQRSITLKIKDMQSSIRDQLTNGGLNIPSDIKLPTAYEVRRSIGSGFGGHASQVSTVNNNQRTSVTIVQSVPTAAVATQIANTVIGIINQQTGQQVRANSTTPRLVSTR